MPAISAILEGLPAGTPAEALLEVPTPDDVLDVTVPLGVSVTWLPRCGAGAGAPAARGQLLESAVARAVAEIGACAGTVTGVEPDDVDVDAGILWDVPPSGAAPPASGAYAWLAGEAGVVRNLRRGLLKAGIPRACVAFMGYWRQGRAECA